VIAERKKDASQGILGFLKTINKKFAIHYANGRVEGSFDIMNEQEIAGGSALDRSKDWHAQDERCWEGVVPVECTSAACGTCWVGVLGGAGFRVDEDHLCGARHDPEAANRRVHVSHCRWW
ncbi:MAG TPA: hypothetical protein PLP26_15270, partial [Ilumatobacteraceae bacterium]|nr:hypothetical protein [Ilumatobacteraceae bacterium]